MQGNKQALVIDDHPLILGSIKNIVEGLGFDVVTAANAEQALIKLDDNQFDLILLDIDLPDMDGKALLGLIKMKHDHIPVLVVSGVLETQQVMAILDQGAQGYIDKAAVPEEFREAIVTVAEGKQYVPYKIQSVVNDVAEKKEVISSYIGITRRQREIISLLAEGLSNKQIAGRLHIAESTVASHVKLIYPALGVCNRTACANVAKELDII